MANGSLIKPEHCSTARYSVIAMQHAVQFVLSDNNIQRLSWATRQLAIDSRLVDFPRLMQKKIRTDLLRDYVEQYLWREDHVGEFSIKILSRP